MNSKLYKKHKRYTKARWKHTGLIWTSQEEFEEIYERVITSTNCELCNKPYKSKYDRHMDHIHYIDNKFGWFRNVVCCSCNMLRADNKQYKNNTSGYSGISKKISKRFRQGFKWEFNIYINGKQKTIKTSVNFKYLKKFADQWKIDNNYNT